MRPCQQTDYELKAIALSDRQGSDQSGRQDSDQSDRKARDPSFSPPGESYATYKFGRRLFENLHLPRRVIILEHSVFL